MDVKKIWNSHIRYWIGIGLCLIFFSFVSHSLAVTITDEVGDNWVRWEWDDNTTGYDIYVDGELYADNRTVPAYIIINNLNKDEKHDIQLRNTTDNTTVHAYLISQTSGSVSDTVSYLDSALTHPLFLLVIWILLMVISFKVPLMFIPTFILSIYNVIVVQSVTTNNLIILLFGMLLIVTIFGGFVRWKS